MTESEEIKCHAIIHSHAAAVAGGNLVPVPGLGIAADIVGMTTMCLALASVFGTDNLEAEVAKGIAVGALKKTLLKQPVKTIGKELAKLIPFGGQIASAAISISLVEAAGWVMAKDLEARAK